MGNQNGSGHPVSGDSSWINRDKLLAIELQEARTLRSQGKAVPSDQEIIDRYDQLSAGPTSNHVNDSRKRSISDTLQRRVPSPQVTDEEASDHDLSNFDPRSPEEIALDNDEYAIDNEEHVYQDGEWVSMHAKLRSSSSRIPLATTSAVPVPQEHLDRNAPLPRKRGRSINWEDDSAPNSKNGNRPGSRGGQSLLDDETFSMSTSPEPRGSPSKSRQTSAVRSQKPSYSKSQAQANAKPRGPSTSRNSPPQRPGTSSGPGKGAARASSPEGDPPWLATMYKPDPRLPPDEQLLPTHAKKMMQQQWEREGKPGGTFDREFTPLSVNTREKPPTQPNFDEPDRLQAGSWPLKQSPPIPDGAQSQGFKHASYSTIPRVQSPPVTSNQASPRIQQVKDFQMVVEDDAKGKGCGCCVVM